MQRKAPPRQPERHSQRTQPRRGLGSWIRRGLLWTIAGLLALAVLGTIYQAIATEIDQPSYSRRPDGGRTWPQLAHRTVFAATGRLARIKQKGDPSRPEGAALCS
jgi:hypothetical protein